MSESVQMPALGESVTEGTVTRWLKNVGDSVEVDEPLLEVSTDKVDTEVPSPLAGTLEEILVEEDETVEVGTDLCRIGDGSGASESSDDSSDKEGEPKVEEPKAESKSSGGSGEAVKMPALGESVTEGTVTRWLKAEGDTVEVDEPLLEVSTDKVDTEVPSPIAGTVSKILVQEDETVEVGADLCLIGDGSGGGDEPAEDEPKEEPKDEPKEESKDEPKAEEPKESEAPKQEEAEKAAEQPAEDTDAGHHPGPSDDDDPAEVRSAPSRAVKSGQVYVTPIVRKLAKDKGVDLTQLAGTGVGGRIRKEDVLEAARKAEEAKAQAAASEKVAAPAKQAAPAEPSPLRGTTEKMSRLRKVIATRMVESLQTSAQLTTVVEVDVTRVAALRAAAKDKFQSTEGTKLTFLPFFVKAATEALKSHPKINATIKDDQVEYRDTENIGIAVDTERGLLVPVIKGAGDLTISGIAKAINDLAARAREAKVSPDELSGGTFTITNTGSGGALFDTPIINQPEVAILGVGTIVKRPMVVKDADGNESIGIRSMVYLALSYDHRLVDGADAARYLMAVKSRLEEGDFAAEVGL
ncbi:2-oxoglutarate dehydrogenase, E2 component, dihydrolipoamide succinyltransferase [Bowdeniella nasicola]|uniref:Dihydrolipoamide acetyltransferase component of pyruvate dehydrogenase complex n=1 Tax=Bowdeniella nasicola TaxID=208480 RepID=A0A1Q5Q381_9ACTO|nr:2-oxoglutarate dehydrogenase, E2 component, dihydrolipoamide succinyltransferase [Bowdeniella nasicola]OKL54235.1 2-oxoglutarate dehydrogenase, E2 component, dihydrolipoamide succinyltransferase [Bowdeniella nasicola]